jgi:hypothetical protein
LWSRREEVASSNWKKNKFIHTLTFIKSFFARARERERESNHTTGNNTKSHVCHEHHHDYFFYGENVAIHEREIFLEEDDDSEDFYTSRRRFPALHVPSSSEQQQNEKRSRTISGRFGELVLEVYSRRVVVRERVDHGGGGSGKNLGPNRE